MAVTDCVFQRLKSALKPDFPLNRLSIDGTSPTFQFAMATAPSAHAAFVDAALGQHASTAAFSVALELKYPSTAPTPPGGVSPASTARARPASATTHAPPTIVASNEALAIRIARFFFASPSRVALARAIARAVTAGVAIVIVVVVVVVVGRVVVGRVALSRPTAGIRARGTRLT
jgi:hypothetical protein